MSIIEVNEVSVAINGKQLLQNVSFHAQAGQITGLIGPNGAGKSTLLSVLSGDIEHTGSVQLAGRDPADTPVAELARIRAVMLQDVSVSFDFLVRDIVSMGRRPWQGSAAEEHDEQIIAAAMQAADVQHLASRDIATLSGGERARVALARVLSQQTPVLFLDEPTAALDIKHQEQVLSLVRSIAESREVAVVAVLHDLNAAARYCDQIVCLQGGRVAATGSVEDVYTPQTLSWVYGHPVAVENSRNGITVIPRYGDVDPRLVDILGPTGF
ncbi:MAG: heme ABC transporter ATP-binding protein [Corynebacterium sp.]|nr:heme ABC transporter ATP-binding protein [Corynebacterium sp.]